MTVIKAGRAPPAPMDSAALKYFDTNLLLIENQLEGLKYDVITVGYGITGSGLIIHITFYCYITEKKCKAIVDLAFVVDSSGSISRRNWKLMLAFVKDAISALDVSPKGSHVASVSYSSTAKVDFRFNTLTDDKLNSAELHKLVDKIRHQRGFTYIDRALKLANEEVFSDKGGMRQAVRKVLMQLNAI